MSRAMTSARINIAATSRMVLYAYSAIAGVTDQVLFSMFEASMLAYEAIVAIATGMASTGILAWKAGFQLVTASAILIQAYRLAHGRTELAQQTNMSIQTLRSATTMIGM